MPTYHEGFSLSLTEAAMLGKPIIATEVGGNPELVNSANGILIHSKNVSDLLDAMNQLGNDKERRIKLGEQARKDYKEKFDFSRVFKERFIPLYEDNY
jgi:glycosyltransferase involved in cell wall biosynthesis